MGRRLVSAPRADPSTFPSDDPGKPISSLWDNTCILRCACREYHLCVKGKAFVCALRDGVHEKELSLDGDGPGLTAVYKIVIGEKLSEISVDGKRMSQAFLSPSSSVQPGEYLCLSWEQFCSATSTEEAIHQARRNLIQVMHAQNHTALAAIAAVAYSYSTNEIAISHLVNAIQAHQAGKDVTEDELFRSTEELNALLRDILSPIASVKM